MGDNRGRHVDAGPADIPALPDIPPSELGLHRAGPRIIAPARGKHFIGWQPRRDGKDDAAFIVIRCNMFDDLKVIERFLLAEGGWPGLASPGKDRCRRSREGSGDARRTGITGTGQR